MKKWMQAACASAILLATGLTLAQPDSRDDELRRLYVEATTLAEAGKLTEARDLYLQIWREHRTYDTALNLSQIAYANGDYAAAAEYARFGLEEFPPSENVSTHTHFRKLYREARQQVATVKIAAPAGAEVRIDGRAIGQAPVLDAFVTPGEHRVEARTGSEVVRKTVVPHEGEVVAVSLELGNGAPGAEPAETSDRPPGYDPGTPRLEPRRGPELVPIVVGGGVALVGVGLGIGFTVKANNKASEANAITDTIGDGRTVCGEGNPTPAECDSRLELREEHDRARNTATWSFGVAGAAVAATLAYAFWPRPRRNSAVRVTPTSSGLLVTGRF